MDKRTILHIGLHKTASTFLQDVAFPKVKTYTYLTRPYTQHNFAFNKLQYADNSLYDSTEIVDELQKIAANRLLISDESFSGKPLSFGYINRSMIAERLSQAFPNAEIILFLRGQQDILVSHYNMWIKGYNAGFRNVDDFIWYPKKNYTYHDYATNTPAKLDTLFWNTNKFFLNLECFKYYELVTLYKKLFKKVHVFLYEDLVVNKQLLINRLESILEEKFELSDEVLNKKVNKSLNQVEFQEKIKHNKIKIVTNNKWLKKLLLLYLNRTSDEFIEPKKYVTEISNNIYEENNLKLSQAFPEIGIQNYPEKYKMK